MPRFARGFTQWRTSIRHLLSTFGYWRQLLHKSGCFGGRLRIPDPDDLQSRWRTSGWCSFSLIRPTLTCWRWWVLDHRAGGSKSSRLQRKSYEILRVISVFLLSLTTVPLRWRKRNTVSISNSMEGYLELIGTRAGCNCLSGARCWCFLRCSSILGA